MENNEYNKLLICHFFKENTEQCFQFILRPLKCTLHAFHQKNLRKKRKRQVQKPKFLQMGSIVVRLHCENKNYKIPDRMHFNINDNCKVLRKRLERKLSRKVRLFNRCRWHDNMRIQLNDNEEFLYKGELIFVDIV